jgi:hypothetical protein
MATPNSNPPLPTRAIINQINAAHDAVVESNQTALKHAIAAGELLTTAKAAVGHGNWEDWLAENCPNISLRTARLYMDLAEHDEEIEKVAEENGNTVADLSIRGARKLITKKREGGPAQTTDGKKPSTKGGAEQPAQTASPDLPTLLKNVAADELATAIKQADWGMEEIRKLVSILTIRMQSLGTQAPPLRPQPAEACLPFERPKLGVVATTNFTSEDFASMLDRAIARSGIGPKLIEHRPEGAKSPDPIPPRGTPRQGLFGSPDKRFRR